MGPCRRKQLPRSAKLKTRVGFRHMRVGNLLPEETSLVFSRYLICQERNRIPVVQPGIQIRVILSV